MRNIRELEATLLRELSAANMITVEQRSELLREQTIKKTPILEYIRKNALVPKSFIVNFLAKGFNARELSDGESIDRTYSVQTDELYESYSVIVVPSDEKSAKVYFASPVFNSTWEDISARLEGRKIEKIVVDQDRFEEAAKELESGIEMRKNFALTDNKDLKAIPESQRAIKFVDELLFKCVKLNASDIHVEPQKNNFRIRMRINGVLQKIGEYDNDFFPLCTSRVKLISNLNIAEKRDTQDGAIVYEYKNDEGQTLEVPFRVSVMPLIYGEKIVLRKLGGEDIKIDLNSLGMGDQLLEEWRRVITRPHGIILVSGPTGSGKSTTLQAAINEIKSDEINITTVEDPVEAKISGINQVQIDVFKVSFADALRSILRQDPDVIMVGEIRDKETAEIALRASLTGHLVYSTIHTNDAPSSVTRLVDMGIEPFLVASSVVAVLAQRLVRVLCPHCRIESVTTDVENRILDTEEPRTVFRPCGCLRCNNTGYSSRIGVYELMIVDQAIQRMINDRKSDLEIKRYAIDTLKMHTIFSEAKEKVLSGVTSIEEFKKIVAE